MIYLVEMDGFSVASRNQTWWWNIPVSKNGCFNSHWHFHLFTRGDFPASHVAEKTLLRVRNDHRGILRPPKSETHGPTKKVLHVFWIARMCQPLQSRQLAGAGKPWDLGTFEGFYNDIRDFDGKIWGYWSSHIGLNWCNYEVLIRGRPNFNHWILGLKWFNHDFHTMVTIGNLTLNHQTLGFLTIKYSVRQAMASAWRSDGPKELAGLWF